MATRIGRVGVAVPADGRRFMYDSMRVTPRVCNDMVPTISATGRRDGVRSGNAISFGQLRRRGAG